MWHFNQQLLESDSLRCSSSSKIKKCKGHFENKIEEGRVKFFMGLNFEKRLTRSSLIDLTFHKLLIIFLNLKNIKFSKVTINCLINFLMAYYFVIVIIIENFSE